MNIKEIINITICEFLNDINFKNRQPIDENLQLADKIYFNTGKLSEYDKNIILNITNGDNYTKIIADFYFQLKNNSERNLTNELKELYNDVKNYNKNVFPIIGFDIHNINPNDIDIIIRALKTRHKIIEKLKELPSIAIRNLKNDIRNERTIFQLMDYFNSLEFFLAHYSLLSNRSEELQKKIINKMFKNNITISELIKFAEDKENLIGGFDFTKENILELSQTEDFEVIYNHNNMMIVRVDSPDGIKKIGCNSLWCFTYGSGFDSAYRNWNAFSHNDMVYVIIDFNKNSDFNDFMYVLIKPLVDEDGNLIEYDENNDDDIPLYNMTNENYWNPYSVLIDLFGDNYKEIIYNYLNFEI